MKSKFFRLCYFTVLPWFFWYPVIILPKSSLTSKNIPSTTSILEDDIGKNINLIENEKYNLVFSKNEVVKKIAISEQYLKQSKQDVVKIMEFVSKNPKWPTKNLLLKKIEQSFDDTTKLSLIFSWLSKYQPTTDNGIKHYALSLLAYKSKFTNQDLELLKKAWITCKFNELELINFTYRLNNIDLKNLTNENQTKFSKKNKKISLVNTDLLQEKLGFIISKAFTTTEINKKLKIQLIAIMPIAKIIDDKYVFYIQSIIKLIDSNKNNAKNIYNNLPKLHKANDFIIFLHLQAMYQNIKFESKISNQDLALITKAKKPNTLKSSWWNIINCYTREHLLEEKYKDALKLLNSIEFDDFHSESNRADHLFLKGFTCYKNGNLDNSLKIFQKGIKNVKTINNVSKFKYWAACINELLNQYDSSKKLFIETSELFYTFYGQMAMKKLGHTLNKNELLKKIDYPKIKMTDEVTAVSYLMKYSKNLSLKKRFVYGLIDRSNKLESIAIYKIIAKHQNYFLNTETAKTLMNKYNVFLSEGFPIYKFSKMHTEPELVHAITRQESSFDSTAVAFDGGLGLMQLMPNSAKSIAAKLNITLDMSKIKDADYNVELGSFYLKNNIEILNSCLLGIYSYNCGKHRVKKYPELFTNFNILKNDLDILDIMEKFPVNISREYGKRVWSNYMIYLVLIHGKLNFSDMKLNQNIPF